jgi:hypothetical protein
MADVKYEVVRHDGGFAYKVDDVFSETFPTHELALDAAVSAANRQQKTGDTEAISYQDRDGVWHEELAAGNDRPETEIEDDLVDGSIEPEDHNGEVHPAPGSHYAGRAPVGNIGAGEDSTR